MWMVGWLLVGWLVGWLAAGWLAGWSFVWLVDHWVVKLLMDLKPVCVATQRCPSNTLFCNMRQVFLEDIILTPKQTSTHVAHFQTLNGHPVHLTAYVFYCYYHI